MWELPHSRQTCDWKADSTNILKGKNLTYGHFWGTNGRSFGREGEVVRSKRGFKQHLIGKLFGTGQNCSFKRGVRPTRVFVRRGSTVLIHGKKLN